MQDTAIRPDGPDFLCVGLQKAGTQWLYDQLQHHPQFWMPPIKELHFFDRGFAEGRIRDTARRLLQRHGDDPDPVASSKRTKKKKAPIGDRGLAFLQMVTAFDKPAPDLEDYARLFSPKGELTTGDITPAYSTLDATTAGAIARRFERAKVLLMLREPASRLWSAWRRACERTGVSGDEEQSVSSFRTYAEDPRISKRSFPSMIASVWSDAFGDRFRTFFLDDVSARPAETRAEILAFLGADPSLGSAATADFNRKANPLAVGPSDSIKEYLRDRFQAERVICAETFGGPATKWPDAPY